MRAWAGLDGARGWRAPPGGGKGGALRSVVNWRLPNGCYHDRLLPSQVSTHKEKQKVQMTKNGKLKPHKVPMVLGDTVQIIAGRDKGKVGKVVDVSALQPFGCMRGTPSRGRRYDEVATTLPGCDHILLDQAVF